MNQAIEAVNALLKKRTTWNSHYLLQELYAIHQTAIFSDNYNAHSFKLACDNFSSYLDTNSLTSIGRNQFETVFQKILNGLDISKNVANGDIPPWEEEPLRPSEFDALAVKDTEIQKLKRENEMLKRKLKAIEAILNQ